MGPRISGSWQSTEFGKGKQSNLQAQILPLETIVSKLFFTKKNPFHVHQPSKREHFHVKFVKFVNSLFHLSWNKIKGKVGTRHEDSV